MGSAVPPDHGARVCNIVSAARNLPPTLFDYVALSESLVADLQMCTSDAEAKTAAQCIADVVKTSIDQKATIDSSAKQLTSSKRRIEELEHALKEERDAAAASPSQVVTLLGQAMQSRDETERELRKALEQIASLREQLATVTVDSSRRPVHDRSALLLNQQLTIFDGAHREDSFEAGDFGAYRRYFESILGALSDEDKLLKLKAVLRGRAAQAMQRMDSETQTDYNLLCSALEKLFMPKLNWDGAYEALSALRQGSLSIDELITKMTPLERVLAKSENADWTDERKCRELLMRLRPSLRALIWKRGDPLSRTYGDFVTLCRTVELEERASNQASLHRQQGQRIFHGPPG